MSKDMSVTALSCSSVTPPLLRFGDSVHSQVHDVRSVLLTEGSKWADYFHGSLCSSPLPLDEVCSCSRGQRLVLGRHQRSGARAEARDVAAVKSSWLSSHLGASPHCHPCAHLHLRPHTPGCGGTVEGAPGLPHGRCMPYFGTFIRREGG